MFSQTNEFTITSISTVVCILLAWGTCFCLYLFLIITRKVITDDLTIYYSACFSNYFDSLLNQAATTIVQFVDDG